MIFIMKSKFEELPSNVLLEVLSWLCNRDIVQVLKCSSTLYKSLDGTKYNLFINNLSPGYRIKPNKLYEEAWKGTRITPEIIKACLELIELFKWSEVGNNWSLSFNNELRTAQVQNSDEDWRHCVTRTFPTTGIYIVSIVCKPVENFTSNQYGRGNFYLSVTPPLIKKQQYNPQ